MGTFSLLSFFGALALFMYGIRQTRLGVQLFAGDRLRSAVRSLTGSRFSALLLGIVVTLVLQSSGATTAMLAGFAGTGALTLPQAMGVILGADIGATLVIVLLSVRHIADYSLVLLIVGVLVDIFARRKRTRYAGMILLGMGLIFFGMQLMIRTTSPLRGNPLLGEIFALLAQRPLYAFFGALAFTALVQNSATTLGLTMACAFSGLLGLREAVPIVLGANVGSCTPSLAQGFSDGPAAKRVALAHLLMKSTGAAGVLLALDPFTHLLGEVCSLLPGLALGVAPQVAVAHLTFNLMLSGLFFPLISQGAWLVTKLIPEPRHPEERPFGASYLEKTSLETPALAFANAKREILRMAEIAAEMFRNVVFVFENNDRELIEQIEGQDDKLDILDREVKFYLAKISQESLSQEQGRLELSLVAMTSDLEEIGDIINKNILELALKKINKARQFSEGGWKEIKDLHSKVSENFQLAISTVAAEDESLARKMLRHERHLAELEDQYREAHLHRLHKGLKETIETSSIHLDLLSNFRRVNSKLLDIVMEALPEEKTGRLALTSNALEP